MGNAKNQKETEYVPEGGKATLQNGEASILPCHYAVVFWWEVPWLPITPLLPFYPF